MTSVFFSAQLVLINIKTCASGRKVFFHLILKNQKVLDYKEARSKVKKIVSGCLVDSVQGAAEMYLRRSNQRLCFLGPVLALGLILVFWGDLSQRNGGMVSSTTRAKLKNF